MRVQNQHLAGFEAAFFYSDLTISALSLLVLRPDPTQNSLPPEVGI